ncbi:hypothetical protein Pan181_23250 [Aeoliella mucimassa]|uniref:Sulfotransferase domain protein n=2 Tax=Aeoliella mucimassa TaxID=2527972 RepID=A0A518AN44_9BACT|nr:hypothetical protein Pan181_23250 [Aeoliella mucimassa]
MMQMLAKGGIEPVTDHERQADADNPKGYYEFERVKKIKQDTAWLPDARGKVVKMISQLLFDLPATEHYKVVFMRRDMDEVITSQEKMLVRRGVNPPDPAVIKKAFESHLTKFFAWLPTQSTIDLIEINYNELVLDPIPSAEQIVEFLPMQVDLEQMLTAVDSSLYRNREIENAN